MHGVLAALKDFHVRSAEIFDRIEAKAKLADQRLEGLETRVAAAASCVEAARGSKRPLVVRSAKELKAWHGKEGVRRVLHEDSLAVLSTAAPLPEDAAETSSAPSVKTAAEDLARVVRGVTALDSGATGSGARRQRPGGENLHTLTGRVGAVSDLFLFNADEQPYREYNHKNNLVYRPGAFEEEELDLVPATRPERAAPTFRLDEDAPDVQQEELVFVPKAATKVTFNLPDVLPDLGGVADLDWKQDQPEHEGAAWDRVPASLRRASSRAGSVSGDSVSTVRTSMSRKQKKAEAQRSLSDRPSIYATMDGSVATIAAGESANAPSLFQPRPRQTALPTITEPSPGPAEEPGPPRAPPPPVPAKGKSKGDSAKAAGAPPPPPPKGKGKSKGPPVPSAAPAAAGAPAQDTGAAATKGKGKSGPPPPPSAGKGKSKGGGPPPPPKGGKPSAPPAPKKAAGGGSKAAMFASIKAGAALRKVAPPKERHGAPVGRVL